jgi:hypothetical protein
MRFGGRRWGGRRWRVAVGSLALVACRDVSGFTTHGDRFEGPVVEGDFVRSGVDPGTTLCLTLDTDHLQDIPGTVSTSDGRFRTVLLRSIPQIWHDPLSTLAFGEGRVKNLLYVAAATTPFADGNGPDAFVVVSLMQSGNVEVRLLRGAPSGTPPDDGSASEAGASGDASVAGSGDASVAGSGDASVAGSGDAAGGSNGAEAAANAAAPAQNLFAVFTLSRAVGPCSY